MSDLDAADRADELLRMPHEEIALQECADQFPAHHMAHMDDGNIMIELALDGSTDMMGHSTQETYIVTGNTDAFGVFLGGRMSSTDSLGSTKASAAEPIVISGEGGGGDAEEQESNPRTVQHTTINGAGLMARVLRRRR